MSMTTYTLHERPLTDDELIVPDYGYLLSGGYAAVVVWHTYGNPWSDDEHVRRFRSTDAARRWISAHYAGYDDDERAAIADTLDFAGI